MAPVGEAPEPQDDPVSDVVELRVALDVPQHLATETWSFPVSLPGQQADFDVALSDPSVARITAASGSSRESSVISP